MSADKTIKDKKDAEKPIASTPATPDKKEALSTADLDKVSGGLNPQPLPPRSRASY